MTKKIQIIFPIVALLLGALAYFQLNIVAKPDAHTVAGETVVWKKLEQKIVVINFFAQWCAPCIKEIPELNAFYRNKPKPVAMYMISYDVLSHEQLKSIVSEHNIEVPVIVNSEELSLPFAIPKALPATYIMVGDDSEPTPIYGELTEKQLTQYVNTALESL